MTVQVAVHVGGSMLFSRGAARKLEDLIARDLAQCGHVELDFTGTKTITPSFFDELLWILEEHGSSPALRVVLRNAAEPLDKKFEAVAAGHTLGIHASGKNEWVIERLRVA